MRKILIQDKRIALVTAWASAIAFSTAISFVLGHALEDTFILNKTGVIISQFIAASLFFGILLHYYLLPSEGISTTLNVVKYIPRDFMELGGFVAKPSPWLQQNFAYTIVLEEAEGFERMLGVAKFFMPQDNKLIQLVVVARQENATAIWSRLDSGESDQLRNIRIKMGVPYE
ncbi:hypothetical protein [Roseinatronobacter sp.]|uniref:hypothetical protein n=1 Tax=Roseinatronobacter sp. TaxID=1945755 RepID=UPI003F6FD134